MLGHVRILPRATAVTAGAAGAAAGAAATQSTVGGHKLASRIGWRSRSLAVGGMSRGERCAVSQSDCAGHGLVCDLDALAHAVGVGVHRTALDGARIDGEQILSIGQSRPFRLAEAYDALLASGGERLTTDIARARRARPPVKICGCTTEKRPRMHR